MLRGINEKAEILIVQYLMVKTGQQSQDQTVGIQA